MWTGHFGDQVIGAKLVNNEQCYKLEEWDDIWKARGIQKCQCATFAIRDGDTQRRTLQKAKRARVHNVEIGGNYLIHTHTQQIKHQIRTLGCQTVI